MSSNKANAPKAKGGGGGRETHTVERGGGPADDGGKHCTARGV